MSRSTLNLPPHPRRARAATAAVVALAGLAAILPAAPAAASAPQGGGTLAFTSYRAGVAGVYAADAAGGPVRRLTSTPGAAFEGSAAYSPDGARIAYVCGNFELCVMNADGSAQARVTTNDWPRELRYDRSPAWSPDGTQLAFARTERGTDGIWIVNVDGSGLRRLPVAEGFVAAPAFSPDGATIAYEHSEDLGGGWSGDTGIRAIGVDGSSPRILTGPGTTGQDPAWSPDGRRIAFTSAEERSDDIAVMNADGSGLRRVTGGATDEQDPAWSPDGSRIAFSSTRKRTTSIYHVASAGGRQTRVTTGAGPDIDPSWQPAGAPAPPAHGAPPAAPPSVATAEARLVGHLHEAAYVIGESLAGNPVQGPSSRVATAATRVQRAAQRIGSAARALRPASARGKRLRRVVLESMRGAKAIAGHLRAQSASLRRNDRRAAKRHAGSAVKTFVGFAFGLAGASQDAGAPQGAI